MAKNLYLNPQMDEAESPLHARRKEETLLKILTETFQELEAVRRCRDHHNETAGGTKSTEEEADREVGEEVQGRTCSPREEDEDRREKTAEEERDVKERWKKVVEVLRELSVFHFDRVRAWRDVLREYEHMFSKSPPGGSDEQHSSISDPEFNFTDSICAAVLEEDLTNIIEKLNVIIRKLDKEIFKLSAEEAPAVDSALQETRDLEASQPEDDRNPSHDALELDSDLQQDNGVKDDQRKTPSPEAVQISDVMVSSLDCSVVEETGREEAVKSQGSDNEHCVSADSQTDVYERTEKTLNQLKNQGKEETDNTWITVGLTGQQENNNPDVPVACFIKAPIGVADLLTCELADGLSCLMVTGSEELVSRVISLRVQKGVNFHFPVTLVVPFCACYRGSYRDVAVKMVDRERRASYVTPLTTEGTYGGQRGSFAEVKVYSLGLFAVVSCLKRENYTIPTRGLSLKLPMDPRICLNYLPGSFTAPVMAQTMIQPIDAVLLASVKSRSDAYYSVVATSPILYFTHPSSQTLRRPLMMTLPCPPNPEKERQRRGKGEEQDYQIWSGSTSPMWDQAAPHRGIILGASMKSKEMSSELLVVLGSRDKQWSVLDKVTVRSQQNGLVSFELTENFDRLLVVRLLSRLHSCHLTALAEELEESVCCHAVTIILQRRPDEPHTALLAVIPSKDLNWELSKLKAQGYSGLLNTSSEISMCEGDQLLLRFSGNITSKGMVRVWPNDRLTFHTQQKNHLLLHLSEVDPFGNYSSPHYKGMALFHKVTRGQHEWRGDRLVPVDMKLLGDPVCKLPLTLPKRVRTINRPIMARAKLCEETDSLSDSLLLWLSEELSEEEVTLLVLSLRLRRSAAQLVKLRAGDSVFSQAFHILTMWRRGLPAAAQKPKASQLAHCLAKSGRPDLARELLLRQMGASRPGLVKQGGLKSRNYSAF
ncbi:death domain-containing protein 1 [Cheilinus undulatus]|uniref:death domain-containing protein 1 n=1 Tax=Cheilinus undulatus TaxID=241271 RepID=UPI001BD521E0|nr:death domain-containing protein 1 [Cheilinus undulatus]